MNERQLCVALGRLFAAQVAILARGPASGLGWEMYFDASDRIYRAYFDHVSGLRTRGRILAAEAFHAAASTGEPLEAARQAWRRVRVETAAVSLQVRGRLHRLGLKVKIAGPLDRYGRLCQASRTATTER